MYYIKYFSYCVVVLVLVAWLLTYALEEEVRCLQDQLQEFRKPSGVLSAVPVVRRCFTPEEHTGVPTVQVGIFSKIPVVGSCIYGLKRSAELRYALPGHSQPSAVEVTMRALLVVLSFVAFVLLLKTVSLLITKLGQFDVLKSSTVVVSSLPSDKLLDWEDMCSTGDLSEDDVREALVDHDLPQATAGDHTEDVGRKLIKSTVVLVRAKEPRSPELFFRSHECHLQFRYHREIRIEGSMGFSRYIICINLNCYDEYGREKLRCAITVDIGQRQPWRRETDMLVDCLIDRLANLGDASDAVITRALQDQLRLVYSCVMPHILECSPMTVVFHEGCVSHLPYTRSEARGTYSQHTTPSSAVTSSSDREMMSISKVMSSSETEMNCRIL